MSIYETKTVRIHLPEKGQYVYLMVMQFDGEDHLLGEDGWRGEYYHYSLISRTTQHQDAATGDAFAFIAENEGLRGTAVEDFVKDLDMERIAWEDVHDEDHLTPNDIDELAGRTEVSP